MNRVSLLAFRVTKKENISTVISKEQAILKKIDNCVKGKLSED